MPKENPVINLSTKLNPQKRKLDFLNDSSESKFRENIKLQKHMKNTEDVHQSNSTDNSESIETNYKKQKSEKKRLESLKKMRQDFKEKKMIIKTGLTGIVSFYSVAFLNIFFCKLFIMAQHG